MARGLINATAARSGTGIIVDGNACIVRSNDISKSGKHGASKCRIEAIGVIDGKKRVLAVPGSVRFEVPTIEKLKGQVLSVNNGMVNMMDLETFENFDVPLTEDAKELGVKDGDSIEYWNVEGIKMIKRVM
ncbi:MAG: translation initiation factor IF-5A [Nanoarchaeota archaeon]